MADPRMTLLDLLAKSEQGVDPTFLRDGLKLLAQELMDAEVTQMIAHARQYGRRSELSRVVCGCPAGCGKRTGLYCGRPWACTWGSLLRMRTGRLCGCS